jgi:glycosyltransferase involved in cell wall biosynthesis
MDILCAPSQTTGHWREQFGRMLVEGFACGLAVIGSSSGEIPHVVCDAGIILPEDDAPAWTGAIANLLDNAPLRRDLGAGGLNRARELYAWPVVARQYLDFFDELLQQDPGPI